MAKPPIYWRRESRGSSRDANLHDHVRGIAAVTLGEGWGHSYQRGTIVTLQFRYPACHKSRSVGSSAKQNSLHGTYQYYDVQPYRPVAYVVRVHGNPFFVIYLASATDLP